METDRELIRERAENERNLIRQQMVLVVKGGDEIAFVLCHQCVACAKEKNPNKKERQLGVIKQRLANPKANYAKIFAPLDQYKRSKQDQLFKLVEAPEPFIFYPVLYYILSLNDPEVLNLYLRHHSTYAQQFPMVSTCVIRGGRVEGDIVLQQTVLGAWTQDNLAMRNPFNPVGGMKAERLEKRIREEPHVFKKSVSYVNACYNFMRCLRDPRIEFHCGRYGQDGFPINQMDVLVELELYARYDLMVMLMCSGHVLKLSSNDYDALMSKTASYEKYANFLEMVKRGHEVNADISTYRSQGLHDQIDPEIEEVLFNFYLFYLPLSFRATPETRREFFARMMAKFGMFPVANHLDVVGFFVNDEAVLIPEPYDPNTMEMHPLIRYFHQHIYGVEDPKSEKVMSGPFFAHERKSKGGKAESKIDQVVVHPYDLLVKFPADGRVSFRVDYEEHSAEELTALKRQDWYMSKKIRYWVEPHELKMNELVSMKRKQHFDEDDDEEDDKGKGKGKFELTDFKRVILEITHAVGDVAQQSKSSAETNSVVVSLRKHHDGMKIFEMGDLELLRDDSSLLQLTRGSLNTAIDRTSHGKVFVKNYTAFKSREAGFEAFDREFKAYEKIKPHPNILACFGCGDANTVNRIAGFLVLEHRMDCETYQIFVARFRTEPISPSNPESPFFQVHKKIMQDILRALEYLHADNIIHYGIQASKILIMSDGSAKISDFSNARVIQKRGTGGYKNLYPNDGTGPSPVEYNPPEAFVSDASSSPLTEAFDIWRFGVMMMGAMTNGTFSVYNKQTAHRGQEIRDLMLEAFTADTTPLAERFRAKYQNLYNLTQPFIDFLREATHFSQSRRASARQLLRNKYLN